ncbi:tail fiber protein [Vibrio phage vB_VhaP_PG11]|nr:tail fiber protein [Vibrio phage vB_VhaP_PG11]
MVQITGILKDPLGTPLPKKTIRVRPVENGSTLWGIDGKTITGSDGTYDFTLGDGKYQISVLFTPRQYLHTGVVLIDNTVVSPITLEDLLAQHAVCQPVVEECVDVVP